VTLHDTKSIKVYEENNLNNVSFIFSLGNTCQYFNNAKQTWYQLVSTIHQSIIANMIPVSPKYCHNMVLCLSGIVKVPILAIFRKPSMVKSPLSDATIWSITLELSTKTLDNSTFWLF
jgi:hypothetical protein